MRRVSTIGGTREDRALLCTFPVFARCGGRPSATFGLPQVLTPERASQELIYREWRRNQGATSFGMVNDKTVAPFERNSFHAPSKRNVAMAPVGNVPSAGGKRLRDSASASANAR